MIEYTASASFYLLYHYYSVYIYIGVMANMGVRHTLDMSCDNIEKSTKIK